MMGQSHQYRMAGQDRHRLRSWLYADGDPDGLCAVVEHRPDPLHPPPHCSAGTLPSRRSSTKSAVAKATSRDLPVFTHDELERLAGAYNRFADKMRQIIHEVRKASVSIAREAVVVRKNVGETSGKATKQGEITESVFTASNEATQAIQEVSGATEVISQSTDKNLDTARGSLDEMLEIVTKVQSVSDKLGRFNDTVGNLSQRSDSIRQVAALIKEIADQTNLLALNAAIEAARAGEAGRGFAVVADEVRKLAERVNVATTEITDNIGGMISLVRDAERKMKSSMPTSDHALGG